MKLKIKNRPLLQYLLLFVCIILAMVLFRETGRDNEVFVKFVMTVAVLGVGAYYLLCKDKKSIDIVNIIIICGIIIRVGYTIYTPMVIRPHDIWAIDANGTGHYG